MAASTWLKKYAAKGEKTPDDTHRRLAKEFARIEAKYDESGCDFTEEVYQDFSKYGQRRPRLTEDKIFDLFKGFNHIIPGGSVLSGCGTGDLVSLSNCFVIGSPQDSYEDIMTTRSQQVQLMKRRGGVGYDLSSLRPRGSAVNNAAKSSTGAASFMDVNSDLTNETAQSGRRGALMLSINIQHPDAEEFITKKQDLSKVTGANISVKVTDEFMHAVENNEDFILRFPVDTKVDKQYKEMEYNILFSEYDEQTNTQCFFKKVKAAEMWNTLMKCAWNTAEPGILFETAMHNYSPDGVYDKFKMVSTNPCQPEWATVLTPKGISTIGEVGVGDIIWSSEGWTTILNKQCTGVKDVHEYRTTAGSFIGTDNHRIISNGEKIEVKDAESIDVLGGQLLDFKHTDLNVEDVMDGLVLGDGGVHRASNNLVYLCIGENDGDYFESNVSSLIEKHREGIKPYAYEVKTKIEHTELPTTYFREIPDRYFNGTPLKVAGLLRGLYSANGSVVDKRVTFKTSSPKLRDQVQILLSSLGIRSYYTTNKTKDVKFANGTYTCKESYDVSISTDRELFYNLIGFIQKYKMDKLESILSCTSKKGIKTHNIISDTVVSNESVYSITVDNATHTYWTGGLNVSNCGEIPMGPFDSCRLIHLMLLSFIKDAFTTNASIDKEKLYEIAYNSMRLADNLIDLEIEAIDRMLAVVKQNGDTIESRLWETIKDTTIEGRRAGLGFTGLADAIAMLGLKYDSNEGINAVEEIMHTIFEGQLDSTIDMSIERGHFPSFKANNEYYIESGEARGANDWFKWLEETFPTQAAKMRKYGRRNVSWSTVAPTGTVSIMAGCSSGIEPVFMPFYERKRKINNPDDRVDFIDLKGEKFTVFAVVHPTLKRWAEEEIIEAGEINDTTDNWTIAQWQAAFEKSPFYGATAPEINWRQRVKLQGVVQKYITHSISSTINLHKDTTQREINDIYLEAWKAGNKGQTIYRDGCRDGVLTAIGTSNQTKDDPYSCETHAKKRPKRVKAVVQRFSNNREKWVAVVGFVDSRPYEIFTGLAEKINIPISVTDGEVVKVKGEDGKKHYNFVYNDKDGIENTIESIGMVFNSEFWNYGKIISGILRHRMPLPNVVKLIGDMTFDSDNMNTWKAGIVRALKPYIADGAETGEICPECGSKVIYKGGCKECSNKKYDDGEINLPCTYSKCG